MKFLNSNNLEDYSWCYLPATTAICQYLCRQDIYELGKTCTRYRKQLSGKILEKLTTSKWHFTNRKLYKSLILNNSLGSLVDYLERDLGGKAQFANQFAIYGALNIQIAIKISSLLPNIKKLEFCSGYYEGSELSLIAILRGMKYLESVEFWFLRDDRFSFSTNEQIFSRSLKSIKVNIEDKCLPLLSIFDTIDSSYTNLTYLTITSNAMLKNLSVKMSKLKHVKILNCWDLNNTKLIEFLTINSHLKSLEIGFNQIYREAIEMVLILKSLKYLSINKYTWDLVELGKLSPNDSIKKLKLCEKIDGRLALKVIKACKNLQTIEFNMWELYEGDGIEWDKINNKVTKVFFNICKFHSDTYFQNLDTINSFSRIDILSCYNDEDYYIRMLSGDKLKNYTLSYPLIPGDPKLFSIIKN